MDNFVDRNPDANICIQLVENSSSIRVDGLKSSVKRNEIVANQSICPVKPEIPEGYPSSSFCKNLQPLDKPVWTVMNSANLKTCITMFFFYHKELRREPLKIIRDFIMSRWTYLGQSEMCLFMKFPVVAKRITGKNLVY